MLPSNLEAPWLQDLVLRRRIAQQKTIRVTHIEISQQTDFSWGPYY